MKRTQFSNLLPRLRLNWGAPLLCLLLLSSVYAERLRRLTPVDVEPYHARAKIAVDSVRYTIGFWTGVDVPVPESAQELLRPNALLSRSYIDNDPGVRTPLQASLLIVQCRDPRDMQGHYPPICYVAHGQTLAAKAPLTMKLPATKDAEAMDLQCTEYKFTSVIGGQRTTSVVLNTLLIPGKGSTPEMAGVYKAASDYQRRLFGAAQLQIVLPAGDSLSLEHRRAIYNQFLTATNTTLRTLLSADDADVQARHRQ